ncbi:uncharacterized protein TNCV_1908571 [Trichonephila clavipes]|nr:uncharacterized protein TNCV_1908571 [Trichonephila clavipes]
MCVQTQLPHSGQRHSGVCSKLKKSVIDTDSDDEKEMNNAAPVPTSSEMKNIQNKKSVRKIADILQKSKSTVSDVIVKWKRRGSETADKRTGRPKILGERSHRTLKRVMKQNRKSSLVEISQEFQQELLRSSRTKELKNLGFHGRAASHKPNITPQNAKHRLQWCRAHRHWTEDMWKTVLWRDESRFTVWQSDGRVWVGRMPGERFFSDCIVPTVKLGGGSIMGVFLVVWPGSSPDLNPIEHLLDELERRLCSQPNRPSSLQALTSAVMDAWKAIPMVTYQKWVESLPKRVKATINAKGGPTSY